MDPRQSRLEQDRFALFCWKNHNKDRADQSFHLCHFTKSGDLCGKIDVERIQEIQSKLAFQRFEQILETKRIHDCALPHFNHVQGNGMLLVRAVCFTEMTAPSLSSHAENYSPWGVAFCKSFLYNTSYANPVLYLRRELFREIVQQNTDHRLLRNLTPFTPRYDEGVSKDDTVDYSHEREWRTPGPVEFEWENLAWVCVPSIALFQELMPDLYRRISDARVEIKVIDSLMHPNTCLYGYDCLKGEKCSKHHTEDQKRIYDWWARAKSWNCTCTFQNNKFGNRMFCGGPKLVTTSGACGQPARLYVALEQGQLQLAKILIGSEAGGQALCFRNSKDQSSCLHIACKRGHFDMVETLIKAGGEALLLSQRGDGWSCLHLACAMGHLEIAKTLIRKGGEELLFHKSKRGSSCLYVASMNGHLAVVKALIEKEGGKKLLYETRDDQYSCLDIACEKGHLDIANALVKMGGRDLCFMKHRSGCTLRYLADLEA
jgi:hypothetical protein